MELAHWLACVASFVSVFLKGFQHKNVIGGHYRLVFFTSYAMAVTDVVVVGIIVKGGWAVAIPSGTGAALGMVLSMYLHDRFISGKPKGESNENLP